jgi:hypothetical protein
MFRGLLCSLFILTFACGLNAVDSGVLAQQSAPRKEYADIVLAEIGKRAGVTILCDTAMTRERIALPSADTQISVTNVEEILGRIVKTLPGASFAKLYLPPPPKGKSLKGDQVIAFALAQAQLYGPVGALPPPGEVEIFSQRLPEQKAKDVIAALGLKPVYVVMLRGGNYTGIWNTTFGEMRLRQTGNRVSGTYTSSDGVIEGVIHNGVFRFRWLERATGGAGAGRFELSDDGESFSGRWSYEADPEAQGSSWTGTRVSRDPKAPGRPSDRVILDFDSSWIRR